MSLVVLNSRDLVHPDKFKLKVLLCAPPGFGKTEWLGGAPDIGVAACETGEGNGLLTVATRGLDYVEPETISELESVCKGVTFKNKESVGLDSLTSMVRTFIRRAALSIPRKQGTSEKRLKGVPELDDYGVMGVMTHDLLRQLLQLDKHIVVTAQQRIQQPDAETGRGDYLIGPDLPGQMFLGAPAMFDIVLVGRTRQVTKDIDGIKKKVSERYWITAPDGIHLAKCRSKKLGDKPLLEPQEVYDLGLNTGTFDAIYNKVRTAYAEIYAELQKAPISTS